jgi:hypothetical protein
VASSVTDSSFIMFSRLIHVLFLILFTGRYYFTVWIVPDLIYSSVDGLLNFFHFLVIKNSAGAMDIGVKVLWGHIYFNFLEYI